MGKSSTSSFGKNFLPESFYLAPVDEVARALLGKGLRVGDVVVEITETEAYSQDDPASHSFKGVRPRCASMFGRGGIAYVYLCYGVHFCLNVVTGKAGVGEAVLLRGARDPAGKLRLPGPGLLTRGLGIDRRHDGMPFDRPDFGILDLGLTVPPEQVLTTPRIGISKAKERPWRFLKTP